MCHKNRTLFIALFFLSSALLSSCALVVPTITYYRSAQMSQAPPTKSPSARRSTHHRDSGRPETVYRLGGYLRSKADGNVLT